MVVSTTTPSLGKISITQVPSAFVYRITISLELDARERSDYDRLKRSEEKRILTTTEATREFDVKNPVSVTKCQGVSADRNGAPGLETAVSVHVVAE